MPPSTAAATLWSSTVSCGSPIWSAASRWRVSWSGCAGRVGESRVLPLRHDGQNTWAVSKTACPALFAKIFLFPKIRNCDLTSASRAHQEGRFAIVTIRWRGMRWTRSCARRLHRTRTVKPCGPVPSTLGSSCANDRAATVAKKPETPGRARSSRKTIAQGVPDRFGEPVVTTLVCFFVFANEAAGAQNTRHSLRPLFFRG